MELDITRFRPTVGCGRVVEVVCDVVGYKLAE